MGILHFIAELHKAYRSLSRDTQHRLLGKVKSEEGRGDELHGERRKICFNFVRLEQIKCLFQNNSNFDKHFVILQNWQIYKCIIFYKLCLS